MPNEISMGEGGVGCLFHRSLVNVCVCVCPHVQLQFHQNSETFMANSLVSGLGDLRAQVSRQSALLSSAVTELRSQVLVQLWITMYLIQKLV